MSPELGVALIAAVAGPLGGFLFAARKLSGKIKTSDAEDLWKESRSMRDTLNATIDRLERRIAFLEESNLRLRSENWDLVKQVSKLKEATFRV